MTPRLRAYVLATFADASPVLAALEALPSSALGGQDRERVLAAVVLFADGTWTGVEEALKVLRQDWRDLLVWSGLGNADWPSVLDARLGR